VVYEALAWLRHLLTRLSCAENRRYPVARLLGARGLKVRDKSAPDYFRYWSARLGSEALDSSGQFSVSVKNEALFCCCHIL
jgi:hypothetical protein